MSTISHETDDLLFHGTLMVVRIVATSPLSYLKYAGQTNVHSLIVVKRDTQVQLSCCGVRSTLGLFIGSS